MEDGTDALGFFFNKKPVKALVYIYEAKEEVYGSKVSREIDTTYAHTVRIIKELEELDLIKTEKQGRRKVLRVTDKGAKHAAKLQDLLNCMDRGISVVETEEPVEGGRNLEEIALN